jgi:spermidine synthase
MNSDGIFINRDGLEIPYSSILLDTQTNFQKIRIFETQKLGKIIVLDEIMFQAEDGDELTEMATHLPLNVGPKKNNVSVIGAGDGFALKELVKHSELKAIDIVEIDPGIVETCRKIFPFGGAWDDKRVSINIEDGFEYVQKVKNKDLIISTPANIYTQTGNENIAYPLFTKEYYQHAYNALTDDGIFVSDGSTSHYADKKPNWVSIYEDLKTVFPIVKPYFFASKRMPGGSFVLLYASKKYHPIDDYKENNSNLETKYYNKGIHFACFSLPEFLKRRIS